jgi:hypothetical protein
MQEAEKHEYSSTMAICINHSNWRRDHHTHLQRVVRHLLPVIEHAAFTHIQGQLSGSFISARAANSMSSQYLEHQGVAVHADTGAVATQQGHAPLRERLAGCGGAQRAGEAEGLHDRQVRLQN